MTRKADEPLEIRIDERGRVTTSMEEVERVDEAWAIAIGRFIVAFANLEQWTRLFIRTFGTPQEGDAAKRQRLSCRLATMERVLLRLKLTGEVQARVDAAVLTFRKLTPTRHVLDHNPPAVHVYTENPDGTGAFEIRHELHDSQDPKVVVTVEELERQVKEARAADEEFMLLYGLVRNAESRRT